MYVEHTDDYASNVILNLYGLTTPENIMLQIEGLCEKNEIDLVALEKNDKKERLIK